MSNVVIRAMRAKYCEAPAKIHYYLVEWDPSNLSWKDFRAKGKYISLLLSIF